MQIVGIEKVEEFRKKHSNLKNTVTAWRQRVEEATWRSRTDAEETFPTLDYSSRHDAYIFNLGSRYRLIAETGFVTDLVPVGFVSVVDIMHHDEYMRWSHR